MTEKCKYNEPKECPKCKQIAFNFNDYCGARVCDNCFYHKDLGRCFCGWTANGYPLSIEDIAEMEAGA